MTSSGRFPMGFSLVVVSCVVAGIAGVARSSGLLASASTSTLVLALILATLHARFGTPQWRRFFWGFALAGWAYTLLASGPIQAQIRPELVTDVLIDRMMPSAPADAVLAQTWQMDRSRWHLVGHVLFALGAGLAGGLFAQRIGENRGGESGGG